MAEKVKATMYDGEARSLLFTLRQDEDLTGWALTWRLYHPVTAELIVEKTVGDGVTLVNNTAGNRQWRVSLARADTTGLAGAYPMEMVRDDVGSEAVLAIGPLVIRPDESF